MSQSALPVVCRTNIPAEMSWVERERQALMTCGRNALVVQIAALRPMIVVSKVKSRPRSCLAACSPGCRKEKPSLDGTYWLPAAKMDRRRTLSLRSKQNNPDFFRNLDCLTRGAWRRQQEKRALLRGPAAVDRQIGAGDLGGVVAAQE